MFAGFTSQITGWVASKTGVGQPTTEVDPNAMVNIFYSSQGSKP